MSDPITGIASGGVGGSVAIDFGQTEDVSAALKLSGDKVKLELDAVKAEYFKNVNNPDVWASNAAKTAYDLFDSLQRQFTPAHDKIMAYSAGVKSVVDTYRADQQAQIAEAEENLNGSGTISG